MITVCKFDKNRDIQETVPGLEISIKLAISTGVVKDSGTSTPYTEETNVENVGHYLTDAIDIAMAAKRLGESMSLAQPTSATIETPSGAN